MVFLVVGLVVVIGQFDIGGHAAGFQNLWSQPGWVLADQWMASTGTARSW